MAKANSGNPDPSPETRFKPGKSGNPGGLSSETARLIRENAELAMQIRNRLLTSLAGVMNENPTKEDIVDQHIRNEVLKLLKDSEDRGLGAPVQAVDHSSKDGSMTPRDHSNAVLDALKAKHGPVTE